jgi:hypothetical protein
MNKQVWLLIPFFSASFQPDEHFKGLSRTENRFVVYAANV